MDSGYLEDLISGLSSRIEELEEKVATLNKQLNERQGFKDGLVKQVNDLQDKFIDIDSRVDGLETP